MIIISALCRIIGNNKVGRKNGSKLVRDACETLKEDPKNLFQTVEPVFLEAKKGRISFEICNTPILPTPSPLLILVVGSLSSPPFFLDLNYAPLSKGGSK